MQNVDANWRVYTEDRNIRYIEQIFSLDSDLKQNHLRSRLDPISRGSYFGTNGTVLPWKDIGRNVPR